MRCPECGATANDNICLTHGKIGLVGGSDNKEMEAAVKKIAEQNKKLDEQQATIKDLGEKLNAKK